MRMQPSVSVIIPTLNAAGYLPNLLKILKNQSVKPAEILIVDSQSDDDTVAIAREYQTTVLEIKRDDFDHGGTRNWAARQVSGDYLVFLSQDAVPTDEHLIENLLHSFEKEASIAAAYARQLPCENADRIESLTRLYNYPDDSCVKSLTDIGRYGIKTFFFSDVCSIYRRTTFEELGGFESPILTNEDMLMAYRLMQVGYKTCYQTEAKVYHSHNLTLRQQYQRNFDVGAFLSTYPFPVKSEIGEGIRMILSVGFSLLKQFRLFSILRLIVVSLVKWKGNRDGKQFRQYSYEEILKKSAQKAFWKRFFGK